MTSFTTSYDIKGHKEKILCPQKEDRESCETFKEKNTWNRWHKSWRETSNPARKANQLDL